jgi:hypothetical protein
MPINTTGSGWGPVLAPKLKSSAKAPRRATVGARIDPAQEGSGMGLMGLV